MHTRALLPALLLTLGGCAGTLENPVDYVTYREQPLVKQVEDGMSRQQVLAIGGPPSSEVKRSDAAGTSTNYELSHDAHQQLYYVSFDGRGRVDDKGFMSCAQREQK